MSTQQMYDNACSFLGSAVNIYSNGFNLNNGLSNQICLVTGTTPDAAQNTTSYTPPDSKEPIQLSAYVSAKGSKQTLNNATEGADTSTSSVRQGMSASVGLGTEYLGFQGSVSASYESIVISEKSDYLKVVYDMYATDVLIIDQNQVSREPGDNQKGGLRISDELASAFDNVNIKEVRGKSAENFFENFGTHVVCGVCFGGIYSSSMSASTSSYKNSDEFKAAADARYYNITGSVNFDKYKDVSDESVNTLGEDIQCGGDTTSYVLDGSSRVYNDWVASIPDMPAVIGLEGFTQLEPIESFCADPSTQAYLKTYADRVFRRKLKVSVSTQVEAEKGSTPIDVEDDSDPSANISWVASCETEFLVGMEVVGAISDNNHCRFKDAFFVAYDFMKDDYHLYRWQGYKSGGSTVPFDSVIYADQGHALTGIGLSIIKQGDHFRVPAIVGWQQKVNYYGSSAGVNDPRIRLNQTSTKILPNKGTAIRVSGGAIPTSSSGSYFWDDSWAEENKVQKYYTPPEKSNQVITSLKFGTADHNKYIHYMHLGVASIMDAD